MFNCVVCGTGDPKFALPLVKEDGKWMVKPVCSKCRGGLMGEAYSQGKSIRIFSLAGSLNEADSRNANSHLFMPFLSAFARKIDTQPTIRKNGNGDKWKSNKARHAETTARS